MATGGHRCRTRFRSVAPWPEAFSSSERALDRAMGHQIERGLILRDGGNEGNPFLLTSCSSGFSRGGARMGPFSVVQLHRQLPVLLCCPPDQLNGWWKALLLVAGSLGSRTHWDHAARARGWARVLQLGLAKLGFNRHLYKGNPVKSYVGQ
jgi:hypothetical protein